MKKNKLIIVILLLISIESSLFAIPSREQSFYARNMTDSILTIISEIAPSEEDWISPWARYFITESNQKIGLFVRGDFGIRPVPPLVIFPGEDASLLRTQLDPVKEIPPLEILRLFHSVFIVTDKVGNIIKTLDSFTEDDFIFDDFDNIILLIRYE